MAKGVVNIWHSLVTRFGLFFIGLLILAIFCSGLLIYQRASKIIAEFSQERISHTSTLAEQSFFALLTEVKNDISILSENSKLRAFTQAPTTKAQQEIEDLFYVTLKNKPNYFQIRLISLSDAGKEIIRLDKTEKGVIPADQNDLQDKSDRPYFQEALNLNAGEFYFSPISLNEEYGVVDPNHTPTIRAISLIFNADQQAMAMVVINVDLSAFYLQLQTMMTIGVDLMLVDQEGQYLFAADSAKLFSKQLNTYQRFGLDFNKPLSALYTDSVRFENLSDAQHHNYLVQIKALRYSKSGHQIFLVTSLDEANALNSVHTVRKYSFWVIPVISLIALGIALIFMHLFARRIGRLTQTIGNYKQGSSAALDFSKHRKDELGVLARTFSEMKSKIDQQVEDLKDSLSKEQKAIREKNEFLQNMSHELRTPLNAIMGLTQLLKKNKPTPEQAPIVDSIHRSAQSLAGLMYDVLDHQKLLEGQVNLKHAPVSFHQLLTDIYASYQYEAMTKGLKFELDLDPQLQNQWHQSDTLRFSQIVTNLVVNAIKYTKSGRVLLSSRLIANHSIAVSVTDTGAGILPENLEKIRTRFYQEHTAHPAIQDGFGLGLSIVKQLIELFGGALEVTSTKGAGSTFRVVIPTIKTAPPASAPGYTQETLLPKWAQAQRVLHIEDDKSACLLIHQILTSIQVDIVQTDQLTTASDLLAQEPFDLIISDLMLDGHVASTALIDIQKKYKLPLIVLSAFEPEQMKAVSPLYLQKPFSVGHVEDLVSLVLGKSQADTPDTTPSYAQYDHDSAKVKQFLRLLISEFETYLERIHRAFETQNEDEWTAIRHKLITHIRNLKLDVLQATLPDQVHDLTREKLDLVDNLMLYNLCFFRNELRLFEQLDLIE